MEIAKKAFHTNNKKTTSIPELKEQKMGNTREWKSMISRGSHVSTQVYLRLCSPREDTLHRDTVSPCLLPAAASLYPVSSFTCSYVSTWT